MRTGRIQKEAGSWLVEGIGEDFIPPNCDLGRVKTAYEISDAWAIVVPAGVWHNVVNTGSEDLKLYSLYSPPEHPDGTVHVTKADAEEAERAHHG